MDAETLKKAVLLEADMQDLQQKILDLNEPGMTHRSFCVSREYLPDLYEEFKAQVLDAYRKQYDMLQDEFDKL